MRSSSLLVFACYSAACRPPKSGGTGGSVKGGAHDSPISDGSRAAMRALKGEADEIAGRVGAASTDAEFDSLEFEVTRFGTKVHAALESVLDSDEELTRHSEALRTHRAEYDRLTAESTDLFNKAKEAGSAYERERRDLTPEESAEVDRLHGLSQKASLEAKKHWSALSKAQSDFVQRRASVIGQALNEIVPMGGEVAGVPAHRPRKDRWGNVGLTVHDQMTFAAKVYPKAWIEMSNDHATEPHNYIDTSRYAKDAYMIEPLVFRKSTSRAHYMRSPYVTDTVQNNYAGKTVKLTDSTTLVNRTATATGDERATTAYAGVRQYNEITLDNDIGTGIHEYAHRMEHMMPSVARMERRFLERRAGTSTPKPLGSPYGRTEVRLPDSLFDRYAEKVYQSGSNEVMSMGWEHYVTGKTVSHARSANRPDRPDPEHMGLILGMMTTVRSTTRPRKMTLR